MFVFINNKDLQHQLSHVEIKLSKNDLLDNFRQLFTNLLNFPEILLCKINVLDIFNTAGFFKVLLYRKVLKF